MCLMSTAKEEIRQLLNRVPDNASYEEIQYHIFVRQKIERGLADVEAGKLIDQDEVERRFAQWEDESSGPTSR
jgi:predicted transcriptional regulator